MGAREAVRDVAHNLERFVDAIVARTGPHEVVLELAAQASVPVINGLTLREHPCQALADVFTIRERLGRLDGAVVTFVGDGNNVYHSLAIVGSAFGMEIRLAHPPGYGPDPRLVAVAQARAAETGGRLVFGQDPRELVHGADVVYTDAWTSMGQEAEAEARRDAFPAGGCWFTIASDEFVHRVEPGKRVTCIEQLTVIERLQVVLYISPR